MLFTIVVLLVAAAVVADESLVWTVSAKNNKPVEVKDIQRITIDPPMIINTPYQYTLLDPKGSVLASGGVHVADAVYYDTFKNKGLTGGYTPIENIEISVITPIHPNIKYIRLLKDNKRIFEEDISNNPHYLAALNNQGVDLPNNCMTIQSNGDPNQKLDITFVGHNYSDAERQRFINEAMETKNFLLSLNPFNANIERINMYYVNQSLDLGCYNGCSGNPGLICCSEARVLAAGAQCPFTWGTDKIIVLANGLPYGGSSAAGANWAVASNAMYTREVAAHEFGHAFGLLMDEYDYGAPRGSPPPPYIPNCDVQPCSRWMGVPSTSCIPICGYNDHFRSVSDSLMRSIPQSDYGIVSILNMTQRLARFNASPRITSTPVTIARTGQSYTYQVTAVDPDNDPLTFSFTQKPLTMTINPQSGLVTWNPVVSESRAPVVNLAVADGRGGSASQYFMIRLM